MTLRKKTLLIISLTLLSLIVVLGVVIAALVLMEFQIIEKQGVEKNVQRVVAEIDNEFITLERDISEYSDWDETFEFMRDRNIDYVRTNLGVDTFSALLLNFIVLIDNFGDVAASKGFDIITGEVTGLPGGLRNQLDPNDDLVTRGGRQYEALSGLLLLTDGPAYVASRVIRRSSGKGSSRGTIIAGRLLDKLEIAHLSNLTDLTIDIKPIWRELPEDFLTARSSMTNLDSIFVSASDQETISGYTILNDIYDKPTVIVKVSSPRTIFSEGKKIVVYLLSFLVVVGLTFMGITMVLTERYVLLPLSRFNDQVSALGELEQVDSRILVTGTDELSNMALNFNAALEAVELSRVEQKENEDKYLLLLENCNECVIYTEYFGQVIDVNQPALEMFGYSEDEILALNINNLTPPNRQASNDFESIADSYETVLENEKVAFPTRFIDKNGKDFPVDFTASSFELGGKIVIQNIIKDTSFVANAESKISNLASIINHSVNPIIIVNDESTVTYSNDSGVVLLESLECGVDETLPTELIPIVKEVISLGARQDVEMESESGPYSLIFIPVAGTGYVYIYAQDISDKKRLESELERAIALQEATFEATNDGILAVDKEGAILGYNRKFTDIWSIPIELMEAKDDKNLMKVILEQIKDPEGYVFKIMDLYNRPNDESIDLIETTDGRIIERHSWPHKKDGKTIGRVWNFREVSEKEEPETPVVVAPIEVEKEVEKESLHESTLESMSQIVSGSKSMEDVLQNAVNSIKDNMDNVKHVGVYMVEDMKAVLKSHRGFSEDYKNAAAVFDYPRGYIWKTILDGTTSHHPDVENEELFGSMGKKLDIYSYLCIPISLDDDVIGAIALSSNIKHAFSERDIKLLESLTQQIESAFIRAKLTHELKASRDRFNSLADSAPMMIWMYNPNDQYYFFNRRWAKFTGRSLDDEKGMGWTKGIHPDDSEPFLNQSLKAINNREEFLLEFNLMRHDGEYRWVSFSGSPLILDDGSLEGYAGTCTDITTTKHLQDDIDARETRLTTCNNLLLELSKFDPSATIDPKVDLRKITEGTSSALGVTRVSIWLFKDENEKLFCLDMYNKSTNSHHEGDEFVRELYPTFFNMISDMDMIASNDVTLEPTLRELMRNYFGPLDVTSLLAVPIRLSDTNAGVLMIENTESKRDWLSDEEGFAIAVSDIVALNMEHWKSRWLEEELVKSQEEIDERSVYIDSMINNIADGIVATDENGIVTTINPAFTGMFGLNDSACVGRASTDVLSPEMIQLIEATYQNPDKVVTADIPLIDGSVGRAKARVLSKGAGHNKDPLGSIVVIRLKT